VNAEYNVGTAIAHLQQVGLAYGDVRVLDGFDLLLPAGRFVTLLGPSGSGKTSILRLLAGFDRPSAGRVLLGGPHGLQDVTLLPPERRNVNTVFQDYALFPHLSVAGNIAFGMQRRGVPRAVMAAGVARLLALVRMPGMGERMPDRLSGGQRQRVAVARALARDPALLLLDEPLSALDAPLRAEMQAELQALQRRMGKTFLLVTHDQAEAMAISDLVVVIRDGAIEQVGTPETLYAHPATRFVATFVGENNVLSCRVERTGPGRASLAWHGHVFTVAGRPALQPGATVEVAVRPEHLQCKPLLNSRADGVAGTIRRRSFRGSSIMLTVELDHGGTALACMDPAAAQAIGGEVLLTFDPGRVAILPR